MGPFCASSIFRGSLFRKSGYTAKARRAAYSSGFLLIYRLYRYDDGWFRVFCAVLSTFNSNFSKAEFRIDTQIFIFNHYQYVPMRQEYTLTDLHVAWKIEFYNSYLINQNSTKKEISKKLGFQNWRSNVKSSIFFLVSEWTNAF